MPHSPEPAATGEPALDTGAFAKGLLDPQSARPDHVAGPGGKGAEKRYNVYRNNVTVSLVNALADIFPAVQKLTGEAFFRAMAREYVRAHPPTSPLLFRYGQDFAAFIDGFPPAQSLPYLGDVARVERAWLTAYHAADAVPMAPDVLGAIPPDRLAGVRFVMHPAFAVIASPYPVFRIVMMNRDRMPLEKVDMRQPEPVLITRPQMDVLATPLGPGADTFLIALADGATLGEAAAIALGAHETFDLNAALTTLLANGACIDAIDDSQGGDDNE